MLLKRRTLKYFIGPLINEHKLDIELTENQEDWLEILNSPPYLFCRAKNWTMCGVCAYINSTRSVLALEKKGLVSICGKDKEVQLTKAGIKHLHEALISTTMKISSDKDKT